MHKYEQVHAFVTISMLLDCARLDISFNIDLLKNYRVVFWWQRLARNP
jgi:hypothetical protein